MATRLTRPVTRVIADVPRRGPVVVTLALEGIVFRYPRKRTTYLLPYGVGMLRAEYLAAAALSAEKNAKKKARKIARRAAL